MKKIVALALCLIMALSLATVAFGVAPVLGSTELKVSDYSYMDMRNHAIDQTPDALYYIAETKTTTTVNGDTTVTVTPAAYLSVWESGTVQLAVVCDDSVANYKVIKGGKVVDFVYVGNTTMTVNEVTTTLQALASDDVVTKKVAKVDADDAVCGDYTATVYFVDGVAHELFDMETSIENALLATFNGKLIALEKDETDSLVEHKFREHANDSYTGGLSGMKVTYTDNTAKTIATAYCYNCEKYIPVVKASSIASDDAAIYRHAFNLSNTVEYRYLGTAAGTTAATTTTGVSSAKTFDAGVALYAGMALMSVAGSAVVIGKKKEF